MGRTEKKVPTVSPPSTSLAGTMLDQGAPTLEVERIFMGQALAAEDGKPTLEPPAEAAGAEEQGITAWHNSVKINALWINSAQRNAWAAVQGIGWRRVNPANESAFLSLTAMLSHARQMNSSCNVRVESDNLIHEVYVW